MTVGVVLIGCGAVGRKRAAALPESCTLVAVTDPERDRAAAVAHSFAPDAVVADTAEAALGVEGCELAIVATPHAQLVPASLVAVETGCDVLVEKPGGHRVRDVLALRDAAEAAGRRVRVGFNHRFHPAVRTAWGLTGDGVYGALMHIRARYGHGGRVGYEREWRADRAVSGGGELLDQGVHLVDLTRHFAGDADLAFAECRTDFWKMDVEDNAFLALRPRAGGFAWLHASWTEWKNLFSFEIAFERAKLHLWGLGGSYGTERLTLYEMLPEMGPPVTRAWEWPRPDESWGLELEDVLAALAGRPAVGATLDDAAAALGIVEEAYGG